MNGYPNGALPADNHIGGDAAGDGRGPGGGYPPVAEIYSAASEKVHEMSQYPVFHPASDTLIYH